MPTLRTDIIDVCIARSHAPGAFEFLQLLRTGEPMRATWQPVMGHIEQSETTVECARREMQEETGLDRRDPRLLGLWALESVHPFFLAKSNEIVLSPRFLALVVPDFSPRLNHEHSDSRWVRDADAFMWPGQRAAVLEALELLAQQNSDAGRVLRLDLSL